MHLIFLYNLHFYNSALNIGSFYITPLRIFLHSPLLSPSLALFISLDSGMAADVSSLVRLLNGYNDAKESSGGKSTTAPMTRDLLGSSRGGEGGGGDRSLELDLDLQVPTGWEKRLDLKVRFDSITLSLAL